MTLARTLVPIPVLKERSLTAWCGLRIFAVERGQPDDPPGEVLKPEVIGNGQSAASGSHPTSSFARFSSALM